MFTGVLILTAVALLGVLSHRRTKLEMKVYKNIPLSDWIVLIAIPVGLYLGWVIFVKNIMMRPNIGVLPLDDFNNLAVSMLFMLYGFVGVGIHFISKILWRYMEKDKGNPLYIVNEMFHNKFSHYLAFLSGLLVIFMLAVLEVNHPFEIELTDWQVLATLIAGAATGISMLKSVLYTDEWFGGYNKPLFFITFALLILSLNISRVLKLDYSHYPTKLFVESIFISGIFTFLFRQILIYTKLSHKKRLKFLSRLLSV